jgi:integrase
MPKPYRVSPHQVAGRPSYSATFKNAMGVRIHRGLGTEDLSEAELIAAGLVRLWNSKTKSAADVPVDVPLKAVRLYFGETSKDVSSVLENASQIELAEIRSEVMKFPKACREAMTLVLIERDKLRRTNDTLRVEVTGLKRALEDVSTKYRNLKASVLGRASEASSNAKPLYEVLALYYTFIHTKTGRDNARKHMTYACSFVESLPETIRTIAEATPQHVEEFITVQCANALEKQRQRRRFKVRQILGRFVNWACEQCQLPSIMAAVSAPTQNEVLRERGDIHWHELRDVKRVIDGIKDPYWKTLVSTLAYAGLQLAELCWLRIEDVEFDKDGNAQLWITTVDDPEDERAGHAIKAENRRRHVRLHPTLLQPLIRNHIDEGRTGKYFLFPMHASMQRRARTINGGSAERWQVGTLSTVLRGHKGGKHRDATKGILPKGMHAKSLRRTFGSLLLRSGKTTAQVAAAMGNNEKIVARHYARLKGCEVSMDF